MSNRVLRILAVADLPPDPDGGASGTQVRLIRGLRRIGHEVVEIWDNDLSHRIRHGNLHDVLEKPLSYRNVIREKWKTDSFDVVCVNQPMGYLAAKDHRQCRRPGVFVRWSMGLEYGLEQALRDWLPRWGWRKRSRLKSVPGKLLDRLVRRQESCVAKYADGHIVLCEKDREILTDVFGIERERTANVHQAPPEHFQTHPTSPITRERLNHILTVAQFVPYKGLPHIADTINKVLRANAAARFTWAGCGAGERDAALAMLSPIARERSSVIGKLDDSEFLRLFDAHGIFLFPSINEGFGKAFLEAMARGLCVVATNVGGMRDLIVDGRSGFVVQPGDVAGMAARIGSLWGDWDLAERMSRGACATAAEYTWERVARETAIFCERLLGQKVAGTLAV